jgi:predicted MPP superfamily phosphohydrolase
LSHKILYCQILILLACSYFHGGVVLASEHAETFPTKVKGDVQGFSIAALGDLGCTPETNRTINNIKNQSVQLILALGDLSYQRESADCWFDIVAPIEKIMKIVLGDQDYRSDSVLRQYKTHFNLTKDYYSFDYRFVHFVALATEIPYDYSSPQYKFIKNDLEAASQNPDVKWIIVYSYRPQYSSSTEHPGSRELRDTFHPLFQKYDVDLILQAHNHNYQRTYPIIPVTSSSQDIIITDSSSNSYQTPEGQIYLTVGTGGADLHSLSDKAIFTVTQYMGHGFVKIFFNNDGKTLTGIFYSNQGGSAADTFKISK